MMEYITYLGLIVEMNDSINRGLLQCLSNLDTM